MNRRPSLGVVRACDRGLARLVACRHIHLQGPYTGPVSETTTIRVSRQTHGRVTRLAEQRHESIDKTVAQALRALQQISMGRELNDDLTDEERAWLDAELG